MLEISREGANVWYVSTGQPRRSFERPTEIRTFPAKNPLRA
jgi:hypothetical protein